MQRIYIMIKTLILQIQQRDYWETGYSFQKDKNGKIIERQWQQFFILIPYIKEFQQLKTQQKNIFELNKRQQT
ncbi:hypothetical protein IMG5_090370 [Ichthyophthirius multifiliis]|uniref:Uncharacterized protein n=1 Tax=Ichthyophthirius multifiliis TaxID=5932 RepID=G0QR82_ICHMU|nr:hypothetical protein IMG5_090370 [Ichthyophthirius multifiliis]EGR32273.1 hypothetical protein IMG5_090370 [Ichthyophthirius multifiliis]|eukprot:XP_004035759.1 hypothetical protein IMG5_090370 [Ichthyophthirius multifiliis]